MSLFGKRNENLRRGADEKKPEVRTSGASVKVLGGGCAKCHALKASVKAALEALGMDSEVELVTDYAKIASYGVMSTPALVINDKVVCCGRVLTVDEAKALLSAK